MLSSSSIHPSLLMQGSGSTRQGPSICIPHAPPLLPPAVHHLMNLNRAPVPREAATPTKIPKGGPHVPPPPSCGPALKSASVATDKGATGTAMSASATAALTVAATDKDNTGGGVAKRLETLMGIPYRQLTQCLGGDKASRSRDTVHFQVRSGVQGSGFPILAADKMPFWENVS